MRARGITAATRALTHQPIIRYPPADADTFGAKYVQGFYTYLEKAAPAKVGEESSAV